MAIYGSRVLGVTAYERRKCGTCGKMFECPRQTRYKVVHKNRATHYCSYPCFRVADEKERERLRRKAERQTHMSALHSSGQRVLKRAETLPGEIDVLTDYEQYLHRRIDKCEEKKAYYYAAYKKAERGSKTYKKMTDNFRTWAKKLKYETEELERIENRIRELVGEES